LGLVKKEDKKAEENESDEEFKQMSDLWSRLSREYIKYLV